MNCLKIILTYYKEVLLVFWNIKRVNPIYDYIINLNEPTFMSGSGYNKLVLLFNLTNVYDLC